MPENFVPPTPEELEAWVASQPEGSVVGYCQSSGECMLAQYLEEKYPQHDFLINFQPPDKDYPDVPAKVWVTSWLESTDPNDTCEVLSLDARELSLILERFDRISGWNVPITREQALECFNEVDRGGI